MNVEELQKRAAIAKDAAMREKLQLVEAAMRARSGDADDKICQRIRAATTEVEKTTAGAADRGQREAILVRLSNQLYDLRQAVLDELMRNPSRYPTLEKQGPFSFRDVDKWLKTELKIADPEHTSPLKWLDGLANWLHKQQKGGVGRFLAGKPPISGTLKDLYELCASKQLKPSFDFYHQFEDQGIALKVKW